MYFSNYRVSDYQTNQHGKKCSHFLQGERGSCLQLSAVSLQHWPFLLQEDINEIYRTLQAVIKVSFSQGLCQAGLAARLRGGRAKLPGRGMQHGHRPRVQPGAGTGSQRLMQDWAPANTLTDSFYMTNIEKEPPGSQTRFAAMTEGNLFALS